MPLTEHTLSRQEQSLHNLSMTLLFENRQMLGSTMLALFHHSLDSGNYLVY
jgi:hypothetical protein